jgi:hypothetical protein
VHQKSSETFYHNKSMIDKQKKNTSEQANLVINKMNYYFFLSRRRRRKKNRTLRKTRKRKCCPLIHVTLLICKCLESLLYPRKNIFNPNNRHISPLLSRTELSIYYIILIAESKKYQETQRTACEN